MEKINADIKFKRCANRDAIAAADSLCYVLKSQQLKKCITLYCICIVLQNQVATLLQVKSCHADASQIQRLTQALVQKEGEVKMLNTKISTLEKQKVTSTYISIKLLLYD